MLDEVSDAPVSLRLAEAARAHPVLNGNQIHRVSLLDQEPEPVREEGLVDAGRIQGAGGTRRPRRCGERQGQQWEQQSGTEAVEAPGGGVPTHRWGFLRR